MGKMDVCAYIVSFPRMGITGRSYWPESRSGRTCYSGVGGIPAFYRCLCSPFIALHTRGSSSATHYFAPLYYLYNPPDRSYRHSHAYADFSGPAFIYYVCPYGSYLSSESLNNCSDCLATRYIIPLSVLEESAINIWTNLDHHNWGTAMDI